MSDGIRAREAGRTEPKVKCTICGNYYPESAISKNGFTNPVCNRCARRLCQTRYWINTKHYLPRLKKTARKNAYRFRDVEKEYG